MRRNDGQSKGFGYMSFSSESQGGCQSDEQEDPREDSAVCHSVMEERKTGVAEDVVQLDNQTVAQKFKRLPESPAPV